MKLRLGEEAAADGLTVAFRYENGDERISVRLTAGADWRDVTLDRGIARRFREWVIELGERARDGLEHLRIERRADEERAVAWDEPFALAPHQVVIAPDGMRVAVSELGAARASLIVDHGEDRDEVDIGEGRFGRWRDCLFRREAGGELVLSRATASRALEYGARLELALGETAAHPDGTRLYVTTVARVYSNLHVVGVELARGRLRRSERLPDERTVRAGSPGRT